MIDINSIWDDYSEEVLCLEKFIGDDMCMQISELLQKDSKKKSITLRGNCIGSRGAYFLSQMLEVNRTLNFLSVEWNQIGSSGATFIGNSLESNRSLTHLDFRNNGIMDEGAIAISIALQKNCTLRVLDLRWNQISDKGALSFKQALTARDPQLNLLISGNILSCDGMATIEEWSQSRGTENAQEELEPPTKNTVVVVDNSKQFGVFQNEIQVLHKQLLERQQQHEDLERQLQSTASRIIELEQGIVREKFRFEQSNAALINMKILYDEKCAEETRLRDQWSSERVEINDEFNRMTRERDQALSQIRNECDALRDKLQRCEVHYVSFLHTPC